MIKFNYHSLSRMSIAMLICFLIGVFPAIGFSQGRQIDIASSLPDVILDSLDIAENGDILNLIDEGPYEISESISNSVAVTIQADPGLQSKPKLAVILDDVTFFQPDTDLTVIGLEFVGINEATQDTAGRVAKITTGGENASLILRDCVIHDLGNDVIRVEVAAGNIVYENLLVYNINAGGMNFRDQDADTIKVINSTFYNFDEKFRIRTGTTKTNAIMFDGVTMVGFSDHAIEVRNSPGPISIKNTLIVDPTGDVINMPTSNLTVEYCNFYKDPDLVASTDTSMGVDELAVYIAGTGNITSGSDPVTDQGEDPMFLNTEALDFRVRFDTQTATGSENGGPIGDPDWGVWNPAAVEEIISSTLPRSHDLHQNYPNPFNPKTEIRYEIAKTANVKMTVYNVLGQEIIRLVNQNQTPGTYKVSWDGRDANGKVVNSGVYFYRLQADDFVQTRNMLYVK